MSTTKLLRWSGLASILAGVLFALATVLHPPGEDVPAIITAAWVPAHAIGWVAKSKQKVYEASGITLNCFTGA
jgi:hypothetical protein